MSNWVGGLPPTAKSSEGEKKVKKGGRPQSPGADDGDHASRTFFGGAIPPIQPKMTKMSAEDLKPPKVTFVGGPPAAPKPPPPPPPPPYTPPPPPPPSPVSPRESEPSPPPPPPSPVSPRESEPSPPPSPPPPTRPTRLPSVFDKKPKKKKKKKRKKKPPPPKSPVYEEEEEEEPKFGAGVKLPSIFVISHIPATRQEYPSDDGGVYVKADAAVSPRSVDSDDEGPNIPPEVPSYKRGNPFAQIWGKLIDVRNITEVGPHGWHPTSNAPYDVTDDGQTVTVGATGWHESRSE